MLPSRIILKGTPLLAAVLLLTGLFPSARAQSHLSARTAVTPTVPLVTMTVRPNGCTVHVVGIGQTLWAIALAYGVKVEDIQGLNGMGTENVTIYPGQTLVIRCMPLTPTLEPSMSVTPTAGKLKRTPVRASATPARTATRAHPPQATPTVAGSEAAGAPDALVAGLLILTGGTLVVLLIFGLIRKR